MGTRIGTLCVDGKLVLAPMAGITDAAFRPLCKEFGAVLVFTEMVSADALVRDNRRSHRLLVFEDAERPIGVQLFGSDPEIMAEAARIAATRSPDLIDLNFGCPVRRVVKRMAGAALMRTPDVLGRVVRCVADAVDLPVTAKIRSGWSPSEMNAADVARVAQDNGAVAVTVHARTRSMQFSGRADWHVIRRVKEDVAVPVIGNGDVRTPEDSRRMIEETGCDLVMIGRGAMGNPWIFRRGEVLLNTGVSLSEPSERDRIELGIRHMKRAVLLKGEDVGVREMRKHLAWYTRGMRDGETLRRELMQMIGAQNVEDRLLAFLDERTVPDESRTTEDAVRGGADGHRNGGSCAGTGTVPAV